MMNRRGILKMLGVAPLAAAFAAPAFAASPEIFNTDGMAIHGYDPVGYFTEKRPVDGTDDFVVQWMGVRWRFASASNMAAFEANPRAYVPQYGGYCAYALSQGAIATTVPEAWTIHEGKLYLNFSTGVRGIWQKDIPGHVAAADANWPDVLGH